jgi:hypothetical protein
VVLELQEISLEYFCEDKLRLLQRSLESGDDCSGRVIEPCCSNFLGRKPMWSAVLRLLSRKSRSSEKD